MIWTRVIEEAEQGGGGHSSEAGASGDITRTFSRWSWSRQLSLTETKTIFSDLILTEFCVQELSHPSPLMLEASVPSSLASPRDCWHWRVSSGYLGTESWCLAQAAAPPPREAWRLWWVVLEAWRRCWWWVELLRVSTVTSTGSGWWWGGGRAGSRLLSDMEWVWCQHSHSARIPSTISWATLMVLLWGRFRIIFRMWWALLRWCSLVEECFSTTLASFLTENPWLWWWEHQSQ